MARLSTNTSHCSSNGTNPRKEFIIKTISTYSYKESSNQHNLSSSLPGSSNSSSLNYSLSNDLIDTLKRTLSIFSNNSGVKNSSNNLFHDPNISNRNSINNGLGNIMSDAMIISIRLNQTKGMTKGYTYPQSLIHHLNPRLSSSRCTS